MARSPITPPDMHPKTPKSKVMRPVKTMPTPKTPKGANAMGRGR